MRFHWNGGMPWLRLGKLELFFWPPHIAWPRADGAGMDLWGPVCFSCNRLSLGCKKHWFCGMCERCVQLEEPDEEYT